MTSGNNFPFHGKSIYLDVNIFIYAIEGYPQFESYLFELFEQIDAGRLQAITSELSLAEALVKPAMNGNIELEKIYTEAIQSTQWLKVIPVTKEILIGAAKIRGKITQLRLPDAIHLMTAKSTLCSSFLTNDKQLKNFVDEMEVVLLSEVIPKVHK